MFKSNHPAISDAFAMSSFPNVRNNERDALINLVPIKNNDVTLDIQSAGGYLSDEINRKFHSNIECICLEPSDILRGRLNDSYKKINNPVENFYSISNNTIDVALGLAGLHHSNSHIATIREVYRVLKQDGYFAVCDVHKGSRLSYWLNEFVNEHNPEGHQGNFIYPNEVTALCHKVGFKNINETQKDVPWQFDKYEDIAPFFKALFGLSCSLTEINQALKEYFIIHQTPNSCIVEWKLIYCHAQK